MHIKVIRIMNGWKKYYNNKIAINADRLINRSHSAQPINLDKYIRKTITADRRRYT